MECDATPSSPATQSFNAERLTPGAEGLGIGRGCQGNRDTDQRAVSVVGNNTRSGGTASYRGRRNN